MSDTILAPEQYAALIAEYRAADTTEERKAEIRALLNIKE